MKKLDTNCSCSQSTDMGTCVRKERDVGPNLETENPCRMYRGYKIPSKQIRGPYSSYDKESEESFERKKESKERKKRKLWWLKSEKWVMKKKKGFIYLGLARAFLEEWEKMLFLEKKLTEEYCFHYFEADLVKKSCWKLFYPYTWFLGGTLNPEEV